MLYRARGVPSVCLDFSRDLGGGKKKVSNLTDPKQLWDFNVP